jgi:prepilin-type N-terminal cleavage/methylation domain-containing protein
LPTVKRNGGEGFFNAAFDGNKNGLTLIELLVTLAVLGFVISALYTFYIAGLNSWNRNIDQMEYQQSARISMNKIISELRYAHEVYMLDGDTETLYFQTDHKGKSTLFRFRRSGQQLLFEQRGSFNKHHSYNVIALGIKEADFHIDANSTVHITIKVGDEFKEFILRGSVRPRNIKPEDVDFD